MNLPALAQHLKLPDLWQHEAVNHLRAGRDVIVNAPTGAGKTYIFELLVQSGYFKRQTVYTVPTRALANDKYAEWKDANWKVGLATGDRAENVQAPVLVATLETQLEPLIAGRGPALLVIDEYQMLADAARGSHYEAAMILAPPDTQLLLLSGSVENPQTVASWLQRIGRQVEVVTTRERPVPLEDMPIEVQAQKVRGIEGWWPRLAATVLQSDLAPLLIFAPRRKDAEHIATKLASHLPQGQPLSLTQEQRALAGKDLTTLLEKRIAYHHSGLTYAVRAGLVEPLAKAGQLRVIVSTMGLAAGINFSVRSVYVSSTCYHDGTTEQQLTADELLQMFGRAGRRGLDERGYVLSTRDTPSLNDSRPAHLRRVSRLNWPLFLRVMRQAAQDGLPSFTAALDFARKLFAKTPPELGLEPTQPSTATTLVESNSTNSSSGQALFGLHGLRREMLNSAGVWEDHPVDKPGQVPLAEAWIATDSTQAPALSLRSYLEALGPPGSRLYKLDRQPQRPQLYGKELALGRVLDTEATTWAPTQALRKLLGIPRHLESLKLEKVEHVALPRLTELYPQAPTPVLILREDQLWVRYDFSQQTIAAEKDSHGIWLYQPQKRSTARTVETEIQSTAHLTAQAARPGTPIHAWRSLGLVSSDGTPTRRGIIFSFFQHGEGLAIAAALEDETYPIDELIPHLANLRSDCRYELPSPGGSDRLSALCRATYGFVNHTGYLEAGLPPGYGEGTAELLGLTLNTQQSTAPTPTGLNLKKVALAAHGAVAEGDMIRALVEWLSLLRHISHAPDYDWSRWQQLRTAAAQALSARGKNNLYPALPPLTTKQKHDRPAHYMWRQGGPGSW